MEDDKPQDIDVLCVQPNEIAQNAVEPIFLASLQHFEQFHLVVHIKRQCPVDKRKLDILHFVSYLSCHWLHSL